MDLKETNTSVFRTTFSFLPLSNFRMDSGYIDFFRDNLLLIALIAFGIFGYFVLLIRKRRKQEFLHRKEEEKK